MPKKPVPTTPHTGTLELASPDPHHGDAIAYQITTDAKFGFVNTMGYNDAGEWIFGNNTPFSNFAGAAEFAESVTLSSAAWQSGGAHVTATLHATNSDGQSGDQVLDSIRFDVAA